MLYYTNTTGPSTEGFLLGFAKSLELAKASGINQMLFSVHTLANLKGVFADIFGDQVVKKFEKNHRLDIEGVTVNLETERIRSSFRRGVALAPFVSSRLLETIIADPRVIDIVYVPWAPEELEGFLQAHRNVTQL